MSIQRPRITIGLQSSLGAEPEAAPLPQVSGLARPPRVCLLFPPNWTPTMPHLALPTLTAYLRQEGVQVMQRDLNIEVFDEILTETHLLGCVDLVRERFGPTAAGRQTGPLPPPQSVAWGLREGPQLAAQAEDAKEVIRSEAFYDGPIGFANFRIMAQCLELASLPFYPAALHLQGYEAAGPVDSSRFLLQGVSDPRHNMFLDVYRRILLPELKDFQPDLVGISIPSMSQVLPGLTLAHLVRNETNLDAHITIGGPHVSMLHDVLPQVRPLFDLIDSAVLYDGEGPLLQLACAQVSGAGLQDVPNLVYRDGAEIKVTARQEPAKIQNLPSPDFDGFPLDRYLAPELALPLLTARGCYFGQCAFCNVGYGEAETFSQLRARALADQMLEVKSRFGCSRIFFADEAVTPRNLRGLSAILAEEDPDLQWGGCVRFEKVIDAPLLEAMHAGGCRMVLFGLESASQAIIDHMIKGTQLEHMSRILKESAQAGIWNHTFFFFGFPGETLADAQETVNFLYAHQRYIHSAAMGTFLMERLSPAYRYPQSFGVSRIVEEPDRDLAIYFAYEVETGLNEAQAEEIHDRFLESLPDKPYPHYYVSDVYRFLYACHLGSTQQVLPPWLMPAAAA